MDQTTSASTGASPIPIASTEIPLSQVSKNSSFLTKYKNKKTLGIFGGIVIVVIVFLVVMLLTKEKSTPQSPTKPQANVPIPTIYQSTILKVDTSNHAQVLVSSVPHFFDMKLSDIITPYDFRAIFNYKKNLIIVSTSGIIEYNPKTNNIIRQNDPRVFQCINYAAMIGTKLYVACNGWSGQMGKGIFVINLETGKLEKIYKQADAHLSNVSVASVGQTLWVGADNMIVQINTINEKMESYLPDTLGLIGCRDFMIYAYNTNVWTTCIPSKISGVSIYDTASNTWKAYSPDNIGDNTIITLGYNTNTLYFLSQSASPDLYTYETISKTWTASPAAGLHVPPASPEAKEQRTILGDGIIFRSIGQNNTAYLSYYDTVQKKVVDIDLNINPYIGMSDIVNEKRFLFTSKSIDILKNNQFPSFYKKLTMPILSATKTFVDPGENYAVVIGTLEGQIIPNPPFSAYLINIRKGEVTDLIKTNEQIPDISPDKLASISAGIEQDTIVGTTKDAELKDAKTGQQVMRVNFDRKELSISY